MDQNFHLNIGYVFFVTGRSRRALLLIFLALGLLTSGVSYNVAFFVAQIFIGCGDVCVAAAQTLRQSS